MTVVAKPKTADLNPGPGFRVRKQINRPDPALVTGLSEFDTPSISDLMNRLYTMTPAIKNLTAPGKKICSPARTLGLTSMCAVGVVGSSSVFAIRRFTPCTSSSTRGPFVVTDQVRRGVPSLSATRLCSGPGVCAVHW